MHRRNWNYNFTHHVYSGFRSGLLVLILSLSVSHGRMAQRDRKLGMLLERHDEWPEGSEMRSERAVVKMVVDNGPAQVGSRPRFVYIRMFCRAIFMKPSEGEQFFVFRFSCDD